MNSVLNRKLLGKLAAGGAIVLALFQIYSTAGFGALEAPIQRGVHLALIMFCGFCWLPSSTKKKTDSKGESALCVGIDFLLGCCALAIAGFIIWNIDTLLRHMPYVDDVTDLDMLFGITAIVLTLEITRRSAGWPLVLVALVALLFAEIGPWLPGALHHEGIEPRRLVEQLFILMDGIYGTPLAVAAGMIYAFVLFGTVLECTGMNSLFIDLACLLTRKSKGGPAKAAIFASALFGSISGSAPANVYGTGTFTIPLMKRVGYRASFAGAVEAVASSGGQMMPPIMGAAAFIMADLTGVGYLAVAKAATLPALLYYLSLLLMIHFEAEKNDMCPMPEDQIPNASSVLKRLYYLSPLVILVGLLVMGRSVNFSAYAATLSLLILAYFKQETRPNLQKVLEIMIKAGRNAIMVSACCACAGIIVGVISLTGIGFKFINMISLLAGDNTFILLIYLMLTCIVMGMGVPTAPAYIIVATLGVPAMMKLGIPVVAAHMFVLYYAALSNVTPPVCVAAYAGAAIAEADSMQTGLQAVRLGIVAFIVPFMFIFEPALLWQGSLPGILAASVTALIGTVGVAAGMQGFFLLRTTLWERGLLLLGGLCLIYPGPITDSIGLGSLGGVLLVQLFRRRRQKKTPALI